MKKSIRFTLVTLLACSMAVSCQKSIKDDVQDPVSQPTVRTFTCVIPESDPDSKVAIDNTGKTTWEVDDEILVHGEYIGTSGGKQYSTVITLTAGDISADGKTATISVPIDEDGISGIVPYIHKSGEPEEKDYKSTLYACYPASAVKSGSYRTYYYNVFTSFDKPLMAAYDNDGAFVFYNMGSVITFSVPSSEDFDSYVLEAKDGATTISYGQFSTRVGYHLTEGLKYNCPYVSSDATYGTLAASHSVSGTLVCDDSMHYICIPGGANMDGGFTMYFLKGGDVKKYARVTSNVDLNMSEKKGKVLHLGSISGAKLHTYTPPAHVPAEWTDGTGLSGVVDKSGSPANCYILYASDANKAVKIKAVKGNGSTSVGTIASVSIVWETDNTATAVAANKIVADVDYSADGQYIFIKTPATFTAGNALIAAKNGGGDILWSWHIWMPASNVGSGTYEIATRALQDRNLGALNVSSASSADITAAGLLYQWGRKDPFLNKKNSSSSDNDFSNHALESSISVNQTMSSTKFDSVEASLKQPTVLVGAEGADWLSTSDNTLWGASKTIYDPCPAGYKVPTTTESIMFTQNITDGTTYTAWSYNSAAFNCTIGKTGDGNFSVFPFGYLYSNGRYDKVHERTLIWSATTSSSAGQSKALYIYNGGYGNYGQGRATGGQIRCIAEPTE